MDRRRRKREFLAWLQRTEAPDVVRRVEVALSDPSPQEAELWAALDDARAAYRTERIGPISASLMRFDSDSRF